MGDLTMRLASVLLVLITALVVGLVALEEGVPALNAIAVLLLAIVWQERGRYVQRVADIRDDPAPERPWDWSR